MKITIDEKYTVKITGVLKDIPVQSHFQFDFLASMSSVKLLYRGQLPKTWVWNPCWTYILLKEGSQPDDLLAQFPAFVEKYFYDAEKANISIYLQKLTDIHLKSKLDYEIEKNSDILYVYILISVAIFLLIIAGINILS